MGHKYVYVYNLGDSLNKTFVYESRISSIEVTSIYTIDENGNQIEKAYHNEPILEDLIIANGANHNRSMSDYWGTYGKDYTDFWRLTDKSNADRMNNDPHYDYLVHYEMGEEFGLPDFPLMYTTSLLCRLRYDWSFGQDSPLEQIKKCNYPMLFIHGDKDTFVPSWMIHPLYKTKQGKKSLWITKGTKHAKSYTDYPEEYARRIRDFLNQ